MLVLITGLFAVAPASPVKAEDLSAAEAEKIASVACLYAAAELCMLTTAARIAAAKDEKLAMNCTNSFVSTANASSSPIGGTYKAP